MALLTANEQIMFGKYWGRNDLVEDDGFWLDVLVYYMDVSVPVPLLYNPIGVRRAQLMLECPSGKCGACCRYQRMSLTEHDIERINVSTPHGALLAGLLKSDKQGGYISCENGCPFLKDNACTIYEYRPDVCWLFPIQSPIEMVQAGKKIQQMRVRIKCMTSVSVIRRLVTDAMSKGKLILLPDLTLVSIYEEENETGDSDAVEANDGRGNQG